MAREIFKSRIWIEGKGSYDVVFTPCEDAAAFKPPVTINIPPAPAGNGSADVVTVMLVAHEMKSGIIAKGQRAGEPYERHNFRGADNRSYQTFKETQVSQLSPVVGQGTPVKMRVKANNFKGFDIVEVLGV